MPSGFSAFHDPQQDRLWERVVNLVDGHRDPWARPHQADRDGESITWMLDDRDGREAIVTVREVDPVSLIFHRTKGRPGLWADLVVLRIGVSTMIGFRADPDEPVPSPEIAERPGDPRLEFSVTDDLGTWYAPIGGWGDDEVDFGLRFFPAPPGAATTLRVTVRDRDVVLAEYGAALRATV